MSLLHLLFLEHVLHLAAMLSSMPNDALKPLPPGVKRSIRSGSIQVINSLDRTTCLIECFGRAAEHLFTWQIGVLAAALLIIRIQASHPTSRLVERELWGELAQDHQRQ